MAVELRCPDCRAKLRLAEEPEPGTEVECPECNAIFPAPDPDTGEVPDVRGKKKSKKKKPSEDAPKKEVAADKPKEGEKKKTDKKGPKRRKAKKKETNTAAMILVIVGGVIFLILVVSLLIWYFTRKPASYEMMNYLPEDANEAVGMNIGHMQKYSEFIKVVEPTYKQFGFQKAIEATAKALGIEAAALPDYMVQGWGKNGGALIIRSKKEFDATDLKKLPGAQEGKADGNVYYSINPIPKLFADAPLKVFAPTNRLIVFCEYNIPNATFSKMLNGNKGSDDILPKRLGSLGKRTTRGTFWKIGVLDNTNRPQEPKDKDELKGNFQRMAAKTAAKGRGDGFKASLGSRAVRFEYVLWFEDSDVASELYKQNRDSEITKAQDDSSLDPPKWWRDMADNFLGSKKVANELLTNLAAKSSGDLFIISSECDTKNLMEVLPNLIRKMTGQDQGMSMPAGPGGAAPPGGPGGPAPPAVPGGPPPMLTPMMP